MGKRSFCFGIKVLEDFVYYKYVKINLLKEDVGICVIRYLVFSVGIIYKFKFVFVWLIVIKYKGNILYFLFYVFEIRGKCI